MSKDVASVMIRCFSVIRLLEREQWTSKAEIAREIGRSVRQVERILSQLEEMGFPITHERGQGYRIQSSRGSLPVRLTTEETWALLLLQRCALAEVGPGARQSLGNLIERIRGQLTGGANEALGEMQSWVASEPPGQLAEPQVWQVVTDALSRGLQLRFDYHKLNEPEAAERRVDPWGMFSVGRVWYLQGFDHQRQGVRNFRLNRMFRPVLLDFKALRPEGYQAARQLFHRFDIGQGEAQWVGLFCTQLLHRWLLENPLHPQQRESNGAILVPVRNLSLFLGTLMALQGLERVEPPEVHQALLERMRQRLDRLSASPS